MSSLKEKAKTGYSICENAYLTCEKCKSQNKCGSENCPLVNVLWVRLEDAEQDIEKLQTAFNIIYRTNEKLKQKLQQLLKKFPSKYGGSPANWRVNMYSTREIDEWKKKFEELLKEVKL
jgi:hypothetical protein